MLSKSISLLLTTVKRAISGYNKELEAFGKWKERVKKEMYEKIMR